MSTTWFSPADKPFLPERFLLNYKKNFPLGGQTRHTKSSSQPVKLVGARPLTVPESCSLVLHVI